LTVNPLTRGWGLTSTISNLTFSVRSAGIFGPIQEGQQSPPWIPLGYPSETEGDLTGGWRPYRSGVQLAVERGARNQGVHGRYTVSRGRTERPSGSSARTRGHRSDRGPGSVRLRGRPPLEEPRPAPAQSPGSDRFVNKKLARRVRGESARPRPGIVQVDEPPREPGDAPSCRRAWGRMT
jgi:hypothetical protein